MRSTTMRSFLLLGSVALVSLAATAVTHPLMKQLITLPITLENIAVRSNGHILITSVRSGSIYTVDPTSPQPSASVLQVFPNSTGITGITEIAPDIFVTAAGLWNSSIRSAALGSCTLWTLNLQNKEPIIEKLLVIPQSTGLNGLTAIPDHPNTVLVADSHDGLVYAINVAERKIEGAIDVPELKPPAPPPVAGVNGVRAYKSYLYFTNSMKGLFCRIKISPSGKAKGAVEIISTINATNIVAYDDFAIDGHGTSYVTIHPYSLARVDKDGSAKVVLNGSDVVPDPTSAAFSRGKSSQGLLYVLTNAFSATGVTGAVLQVDTKQL